MNAHQHTCIARIQLIRLHTFVAEAKRRPDTARVKEGSFAHAGRAVRLWKRPARASPLADWHEKWDCPLRKAAIAPLFGLIHQSHVFTRQRVRGKSRAVLDVISSLDIVRLSALKIILCGGFGLQARCWDVAVVNTADNATEKRPLRIDALVYDTIFFTFAITHIRMSSVFEYTLSRAVPSRYGGAPLWLI